MSRNTCNYVFLISKYLTSILQVMNITLSNSYTNNLIRSKCLNTAVMLIVIFIGEKQVPCIQQCDVQNTIHRHVHTIVDKNELILEKLMKSLCNTRNKTPYMYYIMLTDGRLTNEGFEGEYFPGHVFIIEKMVGNEYRLYQSFIGKYDLNAYVVNNKCKRYTLSNVNQMCKYFKTFLATGYVWDNAAVHQWHKLTNVDTTKFLNHSTKNIYLCFKKFKLEKIQCKIKKFVSSSLKEINNSIQRKQFNKFDSQNHLKNRLSASPYDIHRLKKNFEMFERELNTNL
ncbi:hypothetical protein QKU58_gp045 [Pyramimonas orientalis virus]|uniref:Uncharacterized protein n=1 Tax=Pyramimonas orientalis virus 01B TaxID=3134525 RepID=A0A7M3UNL9_9VIRU|nr:hypothetical protein QKU58_gp045 [Pyramimonas orientalis virus]QOI90286.1 hypothetical protein HWQ62_00149 [Pyramimonas orientalis virus]